MQIVTLGREHLSGVAKIEQAVHDLFPHCFRNAKECGAFAHTACKQIGNTDGITGIESGALGNITDLWLSVPFTGGGKRNHAVIILLSKNGFYKGAFACSVRADESNQFTAVHMEVYILQDLLIADLNRQILRPKAAGVTATAAVITDIHPNASFNVLMFWYIAEK